jgi:hypothetical protein
MAFPVAAVAEIAVSVKVLPTGVVAVAPVFAAATS